MNDLLLRGAVHVQIVAQSAPGVRPDPNAPGAGVVQMAINALGYLALGVGVLMIIIGGISWAAARAGNNPKAQSGAGRVVMTGAALGFIVAIAKFAVDTGFHFGNLVK